MEKWKKFEKAVHQLLLLFNKGAEIKYDDKIIGLESGQQRQIDISLKGKINVFDIFIAVSCKDYKNKVDINDIGEFVSVLRDIRANKGVMIASSGFTTGAIELAKNQGIETYSLIDSKSLDSKTFAKLPALLERTYLKNYSFQLSGFSPTGTISKNLQNTDFMLARFLDSDGREDFIRNIVADKWTPELIKPGEVKMDMGSGRITYLNDGLDANLTVILNIAKTYYFGYIPIKTTGLLNAQDGSLTTKSIETDKIVPYEIEQGNVEGWKEVSAPEEIAVSPFMKLVYSDCLSKIGKDTSSDTKS